MIAVTHFTRRPRPTDFSIERLYDDVRVALPADIAVSVQTCPHASQGLISRIADALWARGRQGQVNHVLGDVHYLTFLLDRRRTILTVHDTVSLTRTRGLRRWVLWLFWYWLPTRTAKHIVCISQATRQALIAEAGCDPDRVEVIHNCVSPEFVPSPRPFCADRPRILQVGTGSNKNLERVIEALIGLSCRLVIVGRLTATQEALLAQTGIDHEVHRDLDRDALRDLYSGCDLLVFASTFEGFGLPILEAQATGLAVITSNVWSMPEVAGHGACLVDPSRSDDIGKAVRRIVGDALYRSALITAGLENVARFSATAVAGKYADLYRRVAASA